MRYYRINITRPSQAAVGGRPAQPEKVLRSYTSRSPAGNVLSNALDVEFDMPVTDFATPAGAGYVKVWGIDLQTIDPTNFNLMQIEVFGGMQRGLPLAKPEQAGLLMSGTIQQAFGNWIGTEQTLDLIYTSGNTKPETPINATIVWREGQSMADAIRGTLATAFPGYTASINISPRLVLTQDQPGYYATILQFARFCHEKSMGIIRDAGYRGVQIFLKERQFIVQDATTRTAPKTIQFTDLIGQITWLSAETVSITTVMRGDIQSGDFVTLPRSQTITTSQSRSQARTADPFAGVFQINNARHTGRFRSASGTAWVTTFQASVQR